MAHMIPATGEKRGLARRPIHVEQAAGDVLFVNQQFVNPAGPAKSES